MRNFILLLLPVFCTTILPCPQLEAQTTECCDDPSCKQQAQNLVTQLDKAIVFLGTYPTDIKTDYKGKKDFIDSIKATYPGNYNKLKKAVRNIHKWFEKDVSRRICISRLYTNLSPNSLLWINYFVPTFYSSSFKSPEFTKGAGAHLHVAMGSKSLFTSNERFVSTGGILASYTFTPKNQSAGGRVRIMLGPSFFYSATKTYLLINPRAEFRLFDIGNEMTNIGCIKLITQGNFRNNIQMAGLGIAAEISRFNIEIKSDYEFESKSMLLQTGLMYSIFFNRYKK